MTRLRGIVRVWWQGTPYENEGGNGLFFLNHYQRHWTSRALHAAWEYFKLYHQWIVGLVVAIVLAVAVKMR
jgi:hypothetical protein